MGRNNEHYPTVALEGQGAYDGLLVSQHPVVG